MVHNLHLAEIDLKLELAQRLLTTTFNNLNSPYGIAKQVGWQESIARLLIKSEINNTSSKSNNILGKDIQNVPFEDNPDFFNQMDLMTFDDKTMELGVHDENSKEHSLILTSVTEAANVIEHEIKGMFSLAIFVYQL